MRKIRVVLISSAVSVGVILAAVIAVSLFAARAMTRFERIPLESDPSRVGLEFEDITFHSRDGLLLSGWWIDAGNNSRVIVMVHGSGANRVRPQKIMLGIAKELIDHRYNVLMFDLRGHGESEAQHVSGGLYEKRDLLGAVDFAKSRGMNTIGVLGFSLGAATSLMAVPESEDIGAVVSDSGYADLSDIIDSEFGKRSSLPRLFIPLILFTAKVLYGVDFAAVKPIDAVRKTNVPIFVIHDKNDEMIPVEQAYRLAEACTNPESRLWVVAGSGHMGAYAVNPAEYAEKVIAFFDKALQ